MSRTTSRGPASVELLCETFQISRQAYYAARKAPKPRRRETLRGHTPTPEAVEALRAVCAAKLAWGVRKVWAILRRKKPMVSRRRVWNPKAADGLPRARGGKQVRPRFAPASAAGLTVTRKVFQIAPRH